MKASGAAVPAEVPLIDLRAQYRELKQDIDAAVARVLENQHFILGPEVAAFEVAFGEFLGGSEVVGVASGTAALHLSLVASGVGPGDEVITTPHTFIATAEAISHTGARPVFVDIDPDTYTIDPVAVEAAITPRTKAIVPVHLYGHPADMGSLLPISERSGLRLVEDAAQAHGAAFEGQRCGTLGDLAAFSFYPGKNLGAFGDAGAVSGQDGELLARVRKLRDHGRTSKYEHDEVGFGERLDALQAAVLGVKLRHLEAWTDARRTVAAWYADQLKGTPIRLPIEAPWARHVYHLYVIRTARRDGLLEALRQAGIGAGIHYPVPLHRQPAYRSLAAGPFPHAERASDEVLSLPMFPEMREDQVAYVADAVRRFFRT